MHEYIFKFPLLIALYSPVKISLCMNDFSFGELILSISIKLKNFTDLQDRLSLSDSLYQNP